MMKESRDIKLSAKSGCISIEMPKMARAYAPKINCRRPGNLILGAFMVFLILLLGGLAIADPLRTVGPSFSLDSNNGLCRRMKHDDLLSNSVSKKNVIMGYQILGAETVCSYLMHCSSGFPDVNGCNNSTVPSASSIEYYVSSELFLGDQQPIPQSNLENVCAINSVSMKTCQDVVERNVKVLIYSVQGLSGFLTGPHSLTVSPYYSTLSDFNCTGSPSPSCIGDDIFKNIFTQSGADDSCSCKASTNKSMVNLKVNGEVYRLDYAFYVYLSISMNKYVEEELECKNCDVSCVHGQVVLDYDHNPEMIELCSGRFCIDVRPAKTFTIPLSLAAMDHSFHYYIRFEDNKEKSGVIQCKVEDLCPLIDCHLCYEKLKNPNCYGALDKINFLLVIFTIFLIFAIIVKIFKVAGYLVKTISGAIFLVFKIGLWVFKKILKSTGMSLVRVTETVSRMEEQKDGTMKKEEYSTKKYSIVRKPIPTYIRSITLITILSLLSQAEACTDSQTVDSSQMDCQMVGGDLKCSLKSSATINVAPVGQSSCFIFKTPDGLNSGSIIIDTLSLDLLCNKEVLYWTYDAKNSFSQVCYCAGSSSGYGNEESCKKYNENTKCKEPLTCPGKGLMTSGCRTAKGGWEEGCFSYSSAYCYYYVDVQNPQKTNYEVSSCSSFYWQANVRVRVQTAEGETITTSKLHPGSRLEFTGGSVTLTGASVPPMPILQSCFVRSHRATFLADCQKRGGIVKGVIGEIQCTSRLDAQSPSNQGCSFAKTIHDIHAQGGSLVLDSSLMSPKTLKKRLPIISGGYTIKEKNGVLSASLNYISMMTIKLNLSGLKLTPYSILSKCTAKFISLSGCVSCLPGSTMKMKMRSDIGSARAVLSCPSLKADVPFLIKPNDEIINLNVHFSAGVLKETCVVKCPGNTVDLAIYGNLVSDVEITRTIEDHLTDITETATNWVRSLMGQFGYSLLIPSAGVLIIGGVIILLLMMRQVPNAPHPKRW